jgi:hypothetical protein
MRIPPHFFADDSKPAASSTEADASRFTTEPDALLEETLLEGTLKLPGVDTTPVTPSMVSIRLGDILEPLADAIRSDRTFLSDFADDEVQLPADLLDCLKAYGEIRRAA